MLPFYSTSNQRPATAYTGDPIAELSYPLTLWPVVWVRWKAAEATQESRGSRRGPSSSRRSVCSCAAHNAGAALVRSDANPAQHLEIGEFGLSRVYRVVLVVNAHKVAGVRVGADQEKAACAVKVLVGRVEVLNGILDSCLD